MSEKKPDEKYKPGEGLRSLKTTNLFRVVNYELYAKPNIVVMGIGLTVLAGCLGYIAYMRQKYEKLGYYIATGQDDTQQFVKKQSRWD